MVSTLSVLQPALIVFMVIVMPLWIIFHYVYSHKRSRGLALEDQQALIELRALAVDLEERIETLEKILDADAPGWRERERA